MRRNMPETVAQHLTAALMRAGIHRLYCLPGYQNDDFFDALYDHRDKLAPIHTRHEQGAAYMALGAAMATGQPQACCVVPGPGFLNTGAALSTAWSVNAPVLMIVGQTPAATYGRELGELHEIPDQLAIIRQFSKLALRIDDPALAAGQISEAMAALRIGRPRPVALEIPMDIWSQPVRPDAPHPVTAQVPQPMAAGIEQAANEIRRSSRPMIVVGSGARDHGTAVLDLARAIGAPVMSNRSGRGIVRADDPLALLPPAGRALWPKMDLVIGLGSRLGAKLAVWGSGSGLRSVHIDIDARELRRGHPADVRIHAGLAAALPRLAQSLGAQPDRSDWRKTVIDTGKRVENHLRAELAPQDAYLSAIRSSLPEDAVLVFDVTQLGYAAEAMFPVTGPRTYLASGYQGTLGWSLPAALGAADALPGRQVAVICGDGGAMYNIQELATAQLHNIPVTVIIFNDGCFGNVRRFQTERFGGRVIAVDLHNPDFVSLARSFGIQAEAARSPGELAECLARSAASGRPRVIEVAVGEFPSPWPYLLPKRHRAD